MNTFRQKTKTWRLLAFTVAAVLTQTISAQQDTREALALQKLKEQGFEDLRLVIKADTMVASLEDHAYRGTFRGAAKAIQSVNEVLPEILHFEILLTDYKMPQVVVHALKRESSWDIAVDREMEYATSVLEHKKNVASSTGKIDITVVPMVSLVNNKLDHLFDYAIRIAPAIAITPWRGGRITLQPIIPISYRLEKGDTKHYIQMGCTNISQQLLSNKRWKLTAAAGFFHMERMGVQANLTLHATKMLDIALEAGQTGETYVHKGGIHLGKWKQTNIMAKADYYEPHTKLQIELQGGRFPYGDYGGRLDVTRHFSEYAIGVYGILTGGEHNAGFHFAIPFGAKRQRRQTFIRLRLPEYYAMEYSMNSFFKYTQENMGLDYMTQPDQNRAAHYWEPSFIEEYVSRILNGSFK